MAKHILNFYTCSSEWNTYNSTKLSRIIRVFFQIPKNGKSYLLHLKKYANCDILGLTKLGQKEAEDRLIHFIVGNKEAGMNWGTLHNYLWAVASFYLINDTPLNLRKGESMDS